MADPGAPVDPVRDAREQFASKMEALARLSGGIAHQFNNLLTAILSTADLALASKDVDPTLRADLEDIREAGKRAAGITRQLLAFGGSSSLALHAIHVRPLVEQLAPLITHLLPPNVRLEMDVSSDAIVRVDPVRLEQVVLNLAVNAVDAMPSGGVLGVIVTDVDGMPPTEGQDTSAGEFTEIVVSDTGQGMTDYARARVFEPFFSTKTAHGGGIGLGLASVYGTLRQLGGGVAIESELGRGSRVRLFVPRGARDEPVKASDPAPDGMLAAEVVLVVEDEPAVRAPLCRALRNLGYFVLEANNGEDALVVMQEYHSPVHLVITDVMMPEMDGAELVSLLRDWYPRMGVLFISGYSPEYLEARGGVVHGSAFLAKPFTIEALERRVRKILDAEWRETT